MTLRIPLITFLLLAPIFIQNIWSQDYFCNTRQIGMTDGLSHYKVLSLYPGEEGMWIGTLDGLNYFDGFNWEYYKLDNKQLSFQEVDFIHQDQEGLLWLFNAKGSHRKENLQAIDILEPGNNQSSTFDEKFGTLAPFQPNDIEQFFEDSFHQIYCFANKQLWKYTPNNLFQRVSLPSQFEPLTTLSDNTFAGVLNDRLVLVSPEGELLHHTNHRISSDLFNIVGTQNQFIISEVGSQLKKYDLQENGIYEVSLFPKQFSNRMDSHVFAYDKDKQLYWAYFEPYLHLINSHGESIYQHPGFPRTTCLDQRGNLWTGLYEIMAFQPRPITFKRYLYQDPKVTPNVERYNCRGLVEINGKLIVGTYLGPREIDLLNGSVRPLLESKHRWFATFKDQYNRIWLGNREVVRLNKLNNKIDSIFYNNDSEDRDRIWSLLEDQRGKIWIGNEGLSFIEKGEIKTFHQYNEHQELRDAEIQHLFIDKNGVIWVVSKSGLYILDPNKGIIAKYGKTQKGKFFLPSDKFQHMYQDEEGVYWLATENKGLIRWDKISGQFKKYGTADGFLSNNIYAIYEDKKNNLWISSFNGLIRFNKSSEEIIIYNEEDGISDNEFNRISHLQTEDGTLYFGGQNGLTAFHPNDIDHKASFQKRFELKVKHISIFGKKGYHDTLANGNPINLANLNSDIKVIDLELASLDLFITDQFDIFYSLERVDNSGETALSISRNNISIDNHIELYDITPGKFQLNIKAIHKNGRQLGKALSIPIKVAYPFYYSYTFWITLIIASSISIWLIFKIRTAHLRKRKEELETLVKERTKQILKDQKTIKSQAEQIAEMREQINKKDQIWLEQFQTIINERLEDTNLDLPAIIDNLDIGRSHFFAKVKALTDMTPNQYIQELRLTKAKNILESGDVKTVKEVAYAVGIRRPGYFSKLFKDRFGVLPSEYFRNHKN